MNTAVDLFVIAEGEIWLLGMRHTETNSTYWFGAVVRQAAGGFSAHGFSVNNINVTQNGNNVRIASANGVGYQMNWGAVRMR